MNWEPTEEETKAPWRGGDQGSGVSGTQAPSARCPKGPGTVLAAAAWPRQGPEKHRHGCLGGERAVGSTWSKHVNCT